MLDRAPRGNENENDVMTGGAIHEECQSVGPGNKCQINVHARNCVRRTLN